MVLVANSLALAAGERPRKSATTIAARGRRRRRRKAEECEEADKAVPVAVRNERENMEAEIRALGSERYKSRVAIGEGLRQRQGFIWGLVLF